jgi:hypothetical protein
LAAGAATGIGSSPIGLLLLLDVDDDDNEDDEAAETEAEAVAPTLRRCMADMLLRLVDAADEDEDDSDMVVSGTDEIERAPLRAELGGNEVAEDDEDEDGAAPLPVASFSFSALKLKLCGVTLGRIDGL